MAHNKTIAQHYVPQFLLYGFASASDKINLFDLKKNEVRFNQAINFVFYENYFYDTDNRVENMLLLLEKKASVPINKIRQDGYSRIEENDKCELIIFLCAQLSRTKAARDRYLGMLDEKNMEKVKASLAKKYHEDTDFGHYHYPKEDLRKISAINTSEGVLHSMVMNDLRFHVLINKTDKEFIISDHPMIVINALYKEESQFMPGPLARGAQLFLPLSKNICLCAYDPKVYKYGGQKSLTASEINLKDVQWLNKLQALSAAHFIGISSPLMEKYVRNLKPSKENCLPSFYKVLKKAKKLYKNPQLRNPQKYRDFLRFLSVEGAL